MWQSPAPGGHVAFDPVVLDAVGHASSRREESWETAAGGMRPQPYGRLFELKNPIDAPGIMNPLSPSSNVSADFVHQNVIPRTSHEGIQFDKAGNMYFIDELNGGNIYKYTSAASFGDVVSGKADYFAAGQTFVLRVGDGNTPNATGAYTWVPFTDAERRRSARGARRSPTRTASPRSMPATPPTWRRSRAPTTSARRTCRFRR